MSEHQHQKAIFDWWVLQYPAYYACLFSIPNGAHLAGGKLQRAKQMNRLKAEGLLPGVSDLFLMVARGGYHGLFIELKDKGKTYDDVSEPQREHIDRAKEQGFCAVWCAGSDDAIKLINQYMRLKPVEKTF